MTFASVESYGDKNDVDQDLDLMKDIVDYRDIISDVKMVLSDDHHDDLVGPFENLAEQATELLFVGHDIKSRQAPLKVAVTGMFNSGKSSFINSLLAESVCPTDACPTTSSTSRFIYGARQQVRVADRLEAESLKEISFEEYEMRVRHSSDDSATQRYFFEVAYPFRLLQDIHLYDTPGFGNPNNPFDTDVTKRETRDADVLFVVMDVNDGDMGHDLLTTLEEVRRTSDLKHCYLILNKADTCIDSKNQKVKDQALRRHGELFDDAFLYSATGEDTAHELEKLLDELRQRALTNIRDRGDFIEKLEGTKHRRKYIADINGREFILSSRPKVWTGQRRVILDLFQKLSEQKHQLLLRSFERDQQQYLRERKKILSQFLKRLERTRKKATADISNHQTQVASTAIAQLESLRDDLPEYFRGLLSQVANSAYRTIKVSREEKSYVLSPYYKVYLNKMRAKKKFNKSIIWDELQRRVKQITPSDSPKIKKKLSALSKMFNLSKGTIKKQILAILKDKAKNNSGYFKPEIEAKNKKKVIEMELKNGDYQKQILARHNKNINDTIAGLRHHIGVLKGQADRTDFQLGEICQRTEKLLEETSLPDTNKSSPETKKSTAGQHFESRRSDDSRTQDDVCERTERILERISNPSSEPTPSGKKISTEEQLSESQRSKEPSSQPETSGIPQRYPYASLPSKGSGSSPVHQPSHKPYVNVGTIGSANDGKTTLTSALMHALHERGGAQKLDVTDVDISLDAQKHRRPIVPTYIEFETAKLRCCHIDCPGNTDFVDHTIATMAQLDVAILVISAAEGPRPQTREHILFARQMELDIVVFINKIDKVVGDELLKLVELETRELLENYDFPRDDIRFVTGSAFQALQDDPQSSTDSSINELISAIHDFDISHPARDSALFMPVAEVARLNDRETVVTGCIERGSIQAEQDAHLIGFSYNRTPVTISGVRVFGKWTEKAVAGENVECFLENIEPSDIKRGLVLAKPWVSAPEPCFETEVYFLGPAERGRTSAIPDGYRCTFYFHTASVSGVIRILDNEKNIVRPGQRAKLFIELDVPVVIERNMRFILRDDDRTVGFGVVTALRNSESLMS